MTIISRDPLPSPHGEGDAKRLKTKAVRGSLWTALESWGRHLIAAAVFIVLGRLLGPQDFGLVALALLVVGLGELIVSDAFAEALVQRKDLHDRHCDAAFWFLVTLAALLTLLLVLMAGPIARLLGDPRAEPLMQALSPVVLLSALATVPVAILRRKLRIRPLALRTFAGLSAGGTVGIAMAVEGYGAWSLVGQLLTQKVVELALVWPAARWRPRAAFEPRSFGELRGYGLPMIGLRLTLYASNNLSRLLAGVLLGAASLGLLQIALRLTSIFKSALLEPIARVALPTTARAQGDPVLVEQVFRTASRLTSLLALPSFVGLALVAPKLIPIVLGAQWTEAVPAAQVLALSGIPAALTRVNNSVLRGLGHARWHLYLALASLGLLACAMAALAPLGIVFIALAVLATSVAMWPIKLYVFHRVTGLPVAGQLRDLLPIAASTAAMAGAVFLWQSADTGEFSEGFALLIEIALGAATFAVTMLAIGRTALRDCLQALSAARGSTRTA
ncbi:lipopolysaccharide biosynthesis protein [Algihabitans albus]|uniref:lipopolysaccharide biosynthesis protein n=1 Tax=Algihabitans albus TaxID=2164067 RepID=UPI0013C2E832|nr:lipopolysaccharide biosynthesis protein [Algihabitans albus]